MEVSDPEHTKSLYDGEKILLKDTTAKILIFGKPTTYQYMLAGPFFAKKTARKVGGTLYLTNKRILFIRDILKEDKAPKTTKDRIALRKEREIYQHLSGVSEASVHTPRFGHPKIRVRYTPISGEIKPFYYNWSPNDPAAEIWVEKIKQLIGQVAPPTSEELAISD